MLLSFFTDGSKRVFETYILPALHTRGTIRDIPVELNGADQRLIPVVLSATLVREPGISARVIHYTLAEVSQIRKLESNVQAAHQQIDQLTAELERARNRNIDLVKLLTHKKEIYRKQSELYQQISEVGRIGGWELDLVTGNLYWSTVTKLIHEVPDTFKPDLDTAVGFYKAGESRDAIQAALDTAIQTGSSFDVELQLVTARDREIWVHAKGYAEREGDKAVRLFGTFHDIDQQKKLMLQLQQSHRQIQHDNAYYKSIIDNQSFYIVKTDLDGRYSFLNRFFCDMLGVQSADWLGKSSLDLILPEDHRRCLQTVEKCFAEPAKTHWVTLRKPSPKGVIVNQWEFKLLTDDNGRFTEFLCIGHEITPLVKKQEELQALVDMTIEQNSRLRNFAFILSHNIRSHVANLSGILNVYDINEATERQTAFALIGDCVQNLDTTIHDLNKVINIQSSSNLPINVLNVCQEINRVVQSIQMQIKSTGATIYCHVDETEQLRTNTAYFESMMLNLLTNAIKFSSPNRAPVIHIRLYPNGPYKVLAVEDNGLGIDLQRHRTKLFTMYKTFHGHKDAKGLGLFITRTQIEALRGKIDVESQVNQGTTFKLYFNENY